MEFLLKQLKDIKKGRSKIFFFKIFLFLKYIFKLPFYIYGLLFCLLFKIIKPFIKFRVQQIPAENFGGFVHLTSLYYIKKKILKEKEYEGIDLLFIKSDFYNKQIKKMFSRKLFILPELLIKPIFEVINLFPFFQDMKIPIFSNRLEYDEDNLFEKYKSLNFTNYENSKGEILLNKFGLKKGQKFICLAVRDKKFSKIKSEILSTDNEEVNNFRNYEIENFLSAAEFCTKKGLFVFRMGKSAQQKINTNNPMIIDYANSELKSDFMDIFLGSNCEFSISTSYGFDSIPYVSNKPMAMITVPVVDFRAHSKRIFILSRRHVDVRTGLDLSLKEIFMRGLAFADTTDYYSKQKVKIIEPNADEIKDFIIEFYNKIYKKQDFSKDEVQLQEKFKNNYLKIFKSSNYFNKKKHFKNLHKNFSSYFSTTFLKNNKNWLS